MLITLTTLALAIPTVTVPMESTTPTPTGCRLGLRAANRPPAQPDSLASLTHPIIIHYDRTYAADQESMAIAALAAIENAWIVQVDGLGFRAPVLPDAFEGPEYDVYLVEYAQGTAFVAADNYQDDLPGDGYNGTSSYMVIDARLPSQWLDSYVAHEFNHACQWATDFSELSLPIWEGTATSAQEWTLGAAGKWDLDVGDFQEATLWPALVADSYQTYYVGGVGYLYEYGAALWVQHLDQKVGNDDGAMGVLLWEETANEGVGFEPDAVDAFAAVAGTTLGEALNSLAITRFLTGDDWDDRGLIEAEGWGRREAVPALVMDATALPVVQEELAFQPMITGQSFVDMDLTGGLGLDPKQGDPWIRVSVSSTEGMDSGVVVMWWDDADQVGDAADWGSTPTVELPASGLTRIAIAVTNLGPSGWDGDDNAFRTGGLELTVEPFSQLPDPTTGSTTDPGTTDPGTTDPGTTDPGTTSNPTGSTGSSSTDDTDGETDEEKSGCGCNNSPSTGFTLLPLLFVAWRRRS